MKIKIGKLKKHLTIDFSFQNCTFYLNLCFKNVVIRSRNRSRVKVGPAPQHWLEPSPYLRYRTGTYLIVPYCLGKGETEKFKNCGRETLSDQQVGIFENFSSVKIGRYFNIFSIDYDLYRTGVSSGFA